MWRTPLPSPALLLPALALSACVGNGQGQVQGTLFIRDCAAQGTTDPTGMPDVPPFQLDPEFFDAEPIGAFPWEIPGDDPRVINRLVIRLQRTGHHYPFTDVFTLFLYDVTGLQQKLGQALPITPPPLNQPYVPLPVDDTPHVEASLQLAGTCPFPLVAPALRGSVTFSAIGFNAGESVAATFAVTAEDLRGERDGLPPADRGVAGAMTGFFDVPIALGSSLDNP